MLVVFGCGNNRNEGDDAQSENNGAIANGDNAQPGNIGFVADYENYIYTMESIGISPVMIGTSGMLAHGERIYYWGGALGGRTGITSINTDGSDQLQIMIETAHVVHLTITENGNIALLDDPQVWSAQDESRNLYYVEITLDGTELIRHDLGDITPQGSDWFDIRGAAFARDGNIAIIAHCNRNGSAVHLLNMESEAVTVLNLNIHHPRERSIVTLQDGRVVVLDIENDRAVLREIDIDSQGWGETIALPEDSHTALRLFCAGEDTPFDLLMSSINNLYGYNIDTGVKTTLLSWWESGIIFLANEHVASLTDGRFAMMSGDLDIERGHWEADLAIFSPMPRGELPERIEITLGGLDISPAVRLAVIEFNRQSETHTIRLYDYSGDDWQALQSGLKRLQIEMMTGTGPDILYASIVGDIQTIAARGMLLDLYPFIDADQVISREDFFPSALSALEHADGTLPLISNRFTIETVIGTQETVGHIESWTPSDMRALIEENLDTPHQFDGWVTGESFLLNMILFAGPELIDWDTYTCDFTSETFIQTLEIARLLPSEQTSAPWAIEELYKGNMLFDITWLRDVERFQDYAELLNDMVVLGMPTADGGTHILGTRTQMGINATTDHADAAWEFLRGFLLPTADIEYGFPVRIDLYDALIAEAMEVHTTTDASGNIVEIPRRQFTWLADEYGRGGVEVSLYAMSEDTAQQLREVVETSKPRGRAGPEIMEFIMGDFATFAAGGRSVEDTARIIQNRVQIWLSEQELVFG